MGQMSRLQKNTTIEAPSREKQTLFVGQFRKTKMCRFHETGRCRYAEKCPFAHSNDELEDLPDLRKTSICKNWQNGCCNFAADRCSFAHGKEELRKTPPFGRKKSQGEGLDRRDSFEGSDTYASTSEGYQGGSFESDRQSSSSFDEEPQSPTRQLAWDPLGLGHGEGRFLPDFMLPASDLMMPFNPMNDEQFQRGGTPPLDASCLQRTGFDSMTNNFVGAMGMPVGQGCPPMVHTMVQFVPMAMPGPVMWDGAPFPASGKELEEMLKQAMPTHYDD